MAGTYSTSDTEQSTLQLVMDQVEELIVTLIEEIRERPGVAAAILAALVGIIVGSAIAGSRGRKASKLPRRPRQMNKLGDAAELAGLGMRLLENPIVRSYLLAMVARQFKSKMPR